VSSQLPPSVQKAYFNPACQQSLVVSRSNNRQKSAATASSPLMPLLYRKHGRGKPHHFRLRNVGIGKALRVPNVDIGQDCMRQQITTEASEFSTHHNIYPADIVVHRTARSYVISGQRGKTPILHHLVKIRISGVRLPTQCLTSIMRDILATINISMSGSWELVCHKLFCRFLFV
jgi:hypothetical protein